MRASSGSQGPEWSRPPPDSTRRRGDVEAVRLMADAVGGSAGVKASGGIRDARFAAELIETGATRLGLSQTAAVLDGFRACRAPTALVWARELRPPSIRWRSPRRRAVWSSVDRLRRLRPVEPVRPARIVPLSQGRRSICRCACAVTTCDGSAGSSTASLRAFLQLLDEAGTVGPAAQRAGTDGPSPSGPGPATTHRISRSTAL